MSWPKFSGVLVLSGGLAFAQFGGVTHPTAGVRAISGIGANASGGNRTSSWQPWLGLEGNYTKNLSTSDAFAPYAPSLANMSGGVSGSKQWATKEISGIYAGSVMYRPTAPPTITHWRTSQNASVSYAQQMNQRLSFSLQQHGGISDGGYGFASEFGSNGVPGVTPSPGGSGTSPNPAINGFVDNETLSGRVKYSLSSGSLSYLFSRRWSVSASGAANFVRRDQGFRGVNSYGGGANTNYQINEQTIVGVGADFFANNYIGMFGNVQGRQYTGSFQRQLNLATTIYAQAGVAQLVSEFIGKVAIPPYLAELLGVSSSLEVTTTNVWTPTYGLGFSKSFLVGNLNMSVARGLGMGNGLVLAGMKDTVAVQFSRPLSSRVGMGLWVGLLRASGRVGVARVSQTGQSGVMMSYRLGHGFNLTGQSGYRYVGVAGYSRRSDFFAGGGIVWSPGDLPFTF